MKGTLACLALVALAPLAAQPAGMPSGVLGDWQDPTGSVIRIGSCGNRVCLWLIRLNPSAPATTDIHNPDPGLRPRALCGLMIGSGFALRDPDHASGGTLYDPKTGKTYHGSITAAGTVKTAAGKAGNAKLELRGYVGIPLFGASQTWTRPAAPVVPCGAVPPAN